ncbi:VOC family protein [Rhodococcus sp. IEGM 1366]|uniref:VOC family protein n=1 Tax=unclassified Rhodococcus (in: high G+C Gram-positive bacteria) TaxID=192944 RepID=UPI000E37EFD7|nr:MULTISPECIES: VOC family protein [unclassified Rhodococcus (in: high G+C Gram-positive bacteria)]MDV8071092.1 VOC family protein [Rhodococcus sp. IEGM 1366]
MKSLSDLLRNCMQLGYVADDIDAAAEFLEKTLGTVQCVKHYRSSLGRRPDEIAAEESSRANGNEPQGSFVVVGGTIAEEWVIDVALVNAGATNIEIIRPVSGAVDLYRGALRGGAPATLHHMGFRVDDFDEASAIVAESGRTWAQYGRSGGIRFGYLDLTAELGHFVEVMELDEAGASGFAKLEAASNAVN